MTLTQYRVIHGLAGLQRLAELTGAKVGYLTTLSYARSSKEPSLSLARDLVRASGGELDYESLCRVDAPASDAGATAEADACAV